MLLFSCSLPELQPEHGNIMLVRDSPTEVSVRCPDGLRCLAERQPSMTRFAHQGVNITHQDRVEFVRDFHHQEMAGVRDDIRLE